MSIYPPLDATAADREPYNPDLFVGRQEELRAIKRKVEEGLAGFPITRPVVHLWGAPGIGKSWLLERLEQRLPDEVGTAVRQGLLSARVDFKDFSFTSRNKADVAALLDQLWIQPDSETLEANLKQALNDFKQAYSGFKMAEAETSELLDRFYQYMLQLSERFVVLFLFDGVEKLDAESFFWLERKLIAPLVRTDRVIFVVAGRKELPRWKEFVVRQRLEVREIQEFSLSDTQEQLSNYKVPRDVLSDIYPYTFGHPYANSVWARAWAKAGGASPEKKRALLEKVEAELLKDIQLERERDILRTLSALRKFNVESARLLLGEIIDPEFKTVSDGYYLRLFEALEQSSLVYWSLEARGYTMGFSVRRMLDLRIQKSDPEKFCQRHKLTQSLYEERFEHSKADRARQLLEILFHAVCCVRGRLPEKATKEQVSQVLEREVSRILDNKLTEAYFDADSIDALFHFLEIDVEFHEVLPSEIYEAVVERVRQFRYKLLSV